MKRIVLLVCLVVAHFAWAAPVVNTVVPFFDTSGGAFTAVAVPAGPVGSTNIVVLGFPAGTSCGGVFLEGTAVFDDAPQSNLYDSYLDTFNNACLNGAANVRLAIYAAINATPFAGFVVIDHATVSVVQGAILNVSGITGAEVSDTSIQCENLNTCAISCTAGHACAGPAPAIRRVDSDLIVCGAFVQETGTPVVPADGSTLEASVLTASYQSVVVTRVESPPTQNGVDFSGVGSSPWAVGCVAFMGS